MATRNSQSMRQAKRRTAKALSVTDWQDLYEMPDDIRKKRSGPARYLKRPVTLSPFCSDAESRYFERERARKASPIRHLLSSVYGEILTFTGSKPYGLRGLLVDTENKPARLDYLAEQFGMSISDIEQALPALEKLGFLERVPMNGQVERSKRKRTQAGRTNKTNCKKNHKSTSPKSRERKLKIRSKPCSEGNTERFPESAGLKRNVPESTCPLSRKNKSKSKSKSKEKENRPSASNRSNQPNADETVTPTAPPTDPPIMPTQSDVLGGDTDKTVSPPAPVHIADDPSHISHALKTVRRRCNRAAVQAGREIYQALGSPWPDDSADSAREVGCFAAQFEKAMSSGLSSTILVDLWEPLVKEGRRLAKLYSKNGGYRSAARVWVTICNKKLAAALRDRAPPEAQKVS